MNIQLFSPPVFHYAGFHYRMMPTLGLPTIAAVLNNAGHHCEVVDLEALMITPDAFKQKLIEQRDRWPDVIGFTCLTVTVQGAQESIKAVRDAGYQGLIMIGGVHPTLAPQEALSWGADLVVTGECEGNIVELIETKATGIHAGKRMSIEDIPAPDWDHHNPAINTYWGNMAIIRPNPGISMWSRGCPFNCLVGETLITLSSGKQIPISKIRAGMSIVGMDLNTKTNRTQRVITSIMTSAEQHGIINISTSNGHDITCTADHRIYTKRGWVKAGNISLLDEVITDEIFSKSSGLVKWSKVVNIIKHAEPRAVYDLETYPDHNFYANNILVHNCIFCSNLIFNGQRTRYRPPANIEAEMKALKAKGCNNAYIYDDELVGTRIPDGWMKDVADRIEPLEINWVTQGRCNKKYVSEELLHDVKRAGCRAIFWGVESFSEKVLKAIKKHTTVEDIWHTLRAAKVAGIENGVFTMIGNYTETEEDLAITCEALAKAYAEGLIQYRQTTFCTAMPGTEFADIQKREGWYKEAPGGGRKMMEEHNSTPLLTHSQIDYWMREFEKACPVRIPA